MKLVRKAKYHLRFKYRKGHNIHSPFVYGLVRGVFMPQPSDQLQVDKELNDRLDDLNQKPQRVVRWCHLYSYLECKSFSINPNSYQDEDMIIITAYHSVKSAQSLLEAALNEDKRIAIVVNGINKNHDVRDWWEGIETGIILDFHSFGVIIVDRLLNSKRYQLKL